MWLGCRCDSCHYLLLYVRQRVRGLVDVVVVNIYGVLYGGADRDGRGLVCGAV